MFYKIITKKRDAWLNSAECQAKHLVNSIIAKGKLREAQIEAVKTYLFLKLKCKNKPLVDIAVSGELCSWDEVRIKKLKISEDVRHLLLNNPAARLLYEYASMPDKKKQPMFSSLINIIENYTDSLNYKKFWEDMFYGVSYTDYIFSLPMGAGKTFLMAAFCYLDLYYATLAPNDKRFAHNFLILAPSGLKTSIMPSLKTIENFDPAWLFDENAALNLKSQIKFEVLDEQKTAKKSNQIRNPNVLKITSHQPFEDMFGLIAISNAEKVILSGYSGQEVTSGQEAPEDQGNELRNVISMIPNLSVFIDEVHHVPVKNTKGKENNDGEIKLRKVVTSWAGKNPSFVSVIGFSGTPYLEKAEQISLQKNNVLKTSFLNNVVCYYPLLTAIGAFLKKPEVKIASDKASRIEIIDNGVRDFLDKYQDTVYPGNLTAKLAIYCGKDIKNLETEVYPQVLKIVQEYGLDPSCVLRFHQGNKEFPINKNAALEFQALDSPVSKIKIVLLVQIGKEGWDCHSLTGVILASENDCSKNMILQTSCRCLRQVSSNATEKALIWLNSVNAKTLNMQLQKQQDTSIAEIKSLLDNDIEPQGRKIYNRAKIVNLPALSYYQIDIIYSQKNVNQPLSPKEGLTRLEKDIVINKKFINNKLMVFHRNLGSEKTLDVKEMLREREFKYPLSLYAWLNQIVTESSSPELWQIFRHYLYDLEMVFHAISDPSELQNLRLLKENIDQEAVRSGVRLCFRQAKDFESKTVPHLQTVTFDMKSPRDHYSPDIDFIYPDHEETERIIANDNNATSEEKPETLTELENLIKLTKSPETIKFLQRQHDDLLKNWLKAKSQNNYKHTYNYVPYRFDSNFEIRMFSNFFLSALTNKGYDVIFNGDDTLGQFKIRCYTFNAKGEYCRLSNYYPDFLITKRKSDNSFDKLLIVETKGTGFLANFKDVNNFMQKFIAFNQEHTNPVAFDFLLLPESNKDEDNFAILNEKMTEFFGDTQSNC